MATIEAPTSRENLPTVRLSARDVRASAQETSRISIVEVLDDRYELRRRLGSGGSAEVYEAWDRVLERMVTVKRMRRDLLADPQGMDRFRREALSLAEVDSDRVVRIIDLRIRPEGSYQVLAHVPGRSLDLIVNDGGPLPALAALRIARDVLEALAGLHRAQITHRDVKPANVLVGDDGRATLLDLGIARSARRRTLTPATHTVGTPLYMAPEQRMSSAVDGRTDLYQVGLLLMYATTAKEPESDVEIELACARMEPRVAAVVSRALASVEERFQSAEEMLAAVQSAMQATIEIGLEDIDVITSVVQARCPLPGLLPEPIPVVETQLARTANPAKGSRRWMPIAALAAVAVLVWVGLTMMSTRHASTPARVQKGVTPAALAVSAIVPASTKNAPAERRSRELVSPADEDEDQHAHEHETNVASSSETALPAPADSSAILQLAFASPFERTPAARRSPRRISHGSAETPIAPTTPMPLAIEAAGDGEADELLRRAAAYERNDAPELAIAALRAFVRIEGEDERAQLVRAHLADLERAR